MRSLTAVFILCLLFPFGLPAQEYMDAGPTQNPGGMEDNVRAWSSLYSDLKARKVGDIVTILIFEYSSASNKTQTATKKENEFSLSGGPGRGALDFIPLYALSSDVKNEYEGSGSTSRSGNLRAKITATVTQVRDNGDLVIRGSRVVEINGEKEIITLSGVVRPEDISPANTVYSYNIADAQISYKGKGAISTGGRPGILTRIINWLF